MIINLSECNALERIGVEAFKRCRMLEEVNLSGFAELKSIGENAFEGCTNLINVNLCNGRVSLNSDSV